MKRRSSLSLILIATLTLTATAGCGTFSALGDKVAGVVPDPTAPMLLPLDETQVLYARAVRNAMKKQGFSGLSIGAAERVWVVSKNHGNNPDVLVDALTYDALVYSLRQAGLSEVVERDDDLMKAMYVEYTESAKLDARDRSLAEQGRLLNADVILAYRVIRINYKSPGFCILGFRFLIGGLMGLFQDAQVQLTGGMRVALELDSIDTKTGQVRASKIVEYVEPQNSWFAQDEAYSGVREPGGGQ